MIFFLIFIFFKFGKTSGCCSLNLGDGTSISLQPLSGKTWTFPLSFMKNHDVTFTICQNLPSDKHCINPTETTGPTPMKDEFSDGNGSCYYIGGLNKCHFSNYDRSTKTSQLYYPGVADKHGEIRNLQLTVHCQTSGTETYNCNDVHSQGNEHTYLCDLHTKYGCPVNNGGLSTSMIIIIICVSVSIAIILIVLIIMIIVILLVIILKTRRRVPSYMAYTSLTNEETAQAYRGSSKRKIINVTYSNVVDGPGVKRSSSGNIVKSETLFSKKKDDVKAQSEEGMNVKDVEGDSGDGTGYQSQKNDVKTETSQTQNVKKNVMEGEDYAYGAI